MSLKDSIKEVRNHKKIIDEIFNSHLIEAFSLVKKMNKEGLTVIITYKENNDDQEVAFGNLDGDLFSVTDLKGTHKKDGVLLKAFFHEFSANFLNDFSDTISSFGRNSASIYLDDNFFKMDIVKVKISLIESQKIKEETVNDKQRNPLKL